MPLDCFELMAADRVVDDEAPELFLVSTQKVGDYGSLAYPATVERVGAPRGRPHAWFRVQFSCQRP